MSRVNRGTSFAELLSKNPRCAEILSKHGLHCIGCHLSASESIEDGARMHGLSDSQIDRLVAELNSCIESKR